MRICKKSNSKKEAKYTKHCAGIDAQKINKDKCNVLQKKKKNKEATATKNETEKVVNKLGKDPNKIFKRLKSMKRDEKGLKVEDF